MFSADRILKLVTDAIPGAEVQVRDLMGDSDHFEITVITTVFEGKGALERHRMVYKALGGAVGQEIHAATLKTMTPKEAGGSHD